MTSQDTDTPEAVSEVADTGEPLLRTLLLMQKILKPMYWTGQEMPFLGWLTAPRARLRQTSKQHERSLRNLRNSCELPRAR